jgi:hypothetical protein
VGAGWNDAREGCFMVRSRAMERCAAVGLITADIPERKRSRIPSTRLRWSARQHNFAVTQNRYARMKFIDVTPLSRASFVKFDARPVRRDIRGVANDRLIQIIDPALADSEQLKSACFTGSSIAA